MSRQYKMLPGAADGLGRARLSTPYAEGLIEQGHLDLVNNAQPYSFAQALSGVVSG